MKCYKLTDSEGYTGIQDWIGRPTKWGEGVTRKINLGCNAREHLRFEEDHLCTPFWFHAYLSPHYAHIWDYVQGGYLHPHRDLYNVLLWECITGGTTKTTGVKVGAKVLTTIKQIPLPAPLSKQEFSRIIEPGLGNCDYIFSGDSESWRQKNVTEAYSLELKDLFNKHYEENYEKQQ